MTAYFAVINKANGESSSRKMKPKLSPEIIQSATDNTSEVQLAKQEIKKQVARNNY